VKGVTRVRCLKKPVSVQTLNKQHRYENIDFEWDMRSQTVVFSYDNVPNGVEVNILNE